MPEPLPSNHEPIDPDNARLWRNTVEITGWCTCHRSYTMRKLVDPQCMYHEFSLDIFEALREERDHGRKLRDQERSV